MKFLWGHKESKISQGKPWWWNSHMLVDYEVAHKQECLKRIVMLASIQHLFQLLERYEYPIPPESTSCTYSSSIASWIGLVCCLPVLRKNWKSGERRANRLHMGTRMTSLQNASDATKPSLFWYPAFEKLTLRATKQGAMACRAIRETIRVKPCNALHSSTHPNLPLTYHHATKSVLFSKTKFKLLKP